MTTANKELDDLIFYAIDKASPYALALHDADNTLEKIKDLTLKKLSITHHGAGIMWLWINAHSHLYGARQVPASISSKAETVADVVKAVHDTLIKP